MSDPAHPIRGVPWRPVLAPQAGQVHLSTGVEDGSGAGALPHQRYRTEGIFLYPLVQKYRAVCKAIWKHKEHPCPDMSSGSSKTTSSAVV